MLVTPSKSQKAKKKLDVLHRCIAEIVSVSVTVTGSVGCRTLPRRNCRKCSSQEHAASASASASAFVPLPGLMPSFSLFLVLYVLLLVVLSPAPAPAPASATETETPSPSGPSTIVVQSACRAALLTLLSVADRTTECHTRRRCTCRRRRLCPYCVCGSLRIYDGSWYSDSATSRTARDYLRGYSEH